MGMPLVIDDGGRALAGYAGTAGDCATRAIAIATRKPYQEVYDALNALAGHERRGSRKRGVSNARTGVYKDTFARYLTSLGIRFTATMGIGTGCKVHLRAGELPPGRLIVRVSKHWVAVIDGVLHDTHDPSRNGTRCVYGYWTIPALPPPRRSLVMTVIDHLKRPPLSHEEHQARHKLLHRAVDELIADYLLNHPGSFLPSLLDLLRWSKEQSDNPTPDIDHTH